MFAGFADLETFLSGVLAGTSLGLIDGGGSVLAPPPPIHGLAAFAR